MSSNAQHIKAYFKLLLEDGQVHSRSELFAYARECAPDKNYSEGMLTGALKTLTDPGTGYKNVGRAQYQKVDILIEGNNYVDYLVESYVSIFKDTLDNIEREVHVNPFKMMELSEDEKKKLREIEKCIDVINNAIKTLD